jgi:transposase-like protein
MKQFKSAGQAQRFLSAHDQINNLFHLRRDQLTVPFRYYSFSSTAQVTRYSATSQ